MKRENGGARDCEGRKLEGLSERGEGVRGEGVGHVELKSLRDVSAGRGYKNLFVGGALIKYEKHTRTLGTKNDQNVFEAAYKNRRNHERLFYGRHPSGGVHLQTALTRSFSPG